jgi:FdhD protein
MKQDPANDHALFKTATTSGISVQAASSAAQDPLLSLVDAQLMDSMLRPVEMTRWEGQSARRRQDLLVEEEPLEIRVNDLSLVITMRTPGQDDALAVGFLVTEGILRSPDDLYDITQCADPENPQLRNTVTVYLSPERVGEDLLIGRQRYASSSCGLCGRATIEMIRAVAEPFATLPPLSASVIRSLPDRLRAGQRVFERTGGLHAAGLFDRDGNLLFVEEDIGRHNAVDKLVGRALLQGRWPLEDTVMMVSGRAGFEIAQKALTARIPVVCSVSAPSSLAAELASEMGMILIGFLRGETMNIYSGAEYIID